MFLVVFVTAKIGILDSKVYQLENELFVIIRDTCC